MAKKILLKILGGAERKRIKKDYYKNYSYKSIESNYIYKIIPDEMLPHKTLAQEDDLEA